MTRLRHLGTGLGVLMLLGACAGSDVGAGSGDGDGTAAADPWADFQSPLGEFLGQEPYSGDPSDYEDEWAEQEREVGVRVTECMAEQGFEYVHPDSGDVSFSGLDDDLPWGSREWTEKYGYGVTTQAFPESSVAPEAVGYPDEGFDDASEFDDPNQEYVESLSESERAAYEDALYGDQPEVDESMTEEEMEAVFEDYEPTGCYDTAWENSYGEDNEQAFYEDFGDEIEDMYARLESDPRLLERQDEVRACVEGEGVTYVTQEEAYEYFGEKLAPLEEAMYDTAPEPEFPEDFDSMTPEEQEAWFTENSTWAEPKLTAEQKSELAELQAEEISMAVASYDCGGGFAQQADLYKELITEYETEFLETHAGELEQYKAS